MIKRLLVANRSEIAIRVFRAASELGITTIAIYAEQDKLALHRFKADEAYQVGAGLSPTEAYLSIEEIMAVARRSGADAIHPGYGFLSESPEFAEACAREGIIFIGPNASTLRLLGDKVAARALATRAGAPVVPATDALPDNIEAAGRMADEIGYPLMLKASWGGGGRGMRPLENKNQLASAISSARSESLNAFGKADVYLEKLLRRVRHVEVQILGDQHGQLVHLFERDCTIQRRHQKVIEQAPASCLSPLQRQRLHEAALSIGRAVNYVGAGTVEFLVDADTGLFYFIEANPRIQVEHTVSEAVTGIDIVKAQIRIAEGGRIGDLAETGVPLQEDLRLTGVALQCRITTENPDNGFVPDYGLISSYRGAFGFGIRADGGTAYTGAIVSRYYDPLLEKVIAWAPSRSEAIARMVRALREYRIRGVATNLGFLESVLTHEDFRNDEVTTQFIDQTPELLRTVRRSDRATKLLKYIADVTVNGHPETRDRPKPASAASPLPPPAIKAAAASLESPRERLARSGPHAFAAWMRACERPLVTDTSMRDAHQSLLATRIRTYDIAAIASAYSAALPDLLSLECWGGATFDVALRFLHEDPWERLFRVRERSPRALLQMLLRGANGVGYTNYPDNAVRHFIRMAAEGGVDLFRIFDCFNWTENMRVAIDAVAETGKIAEGAICYAGDILDPSRTKYPLQYYLRIARELADAGCHVIAIKDMAGLLKPEAARLLVRALRQEIGAPIHLHTHDTSGLGSATILAAVDAGVDAFDAAMDSMSGATSQPCLGSIVAALATGKRSTRLDLEGIQRISAYWEGVRSTYAAFEGSLRSGTSEVYLHELPGGQITNLREQARSLGLENRWDDVARAYRAANDLLGDIIKVTPSSKAVGDMALLMVSQGLSPEDVIDSRREIAFPQSVVDMLRGELGQPPGGWPPELQSRVLQGRKPIAGRPGAALDPVDLDACRSALAAEVDTVDDFALASSLMYPQLLQDYTRFVREYGPVTALPTRTFFYGMNVGEEIAVELEPGKTLVIQLLAVGKTDRAGRVRVFFELNGQPRTISATDRSAAPKTVVRRKAEADDLAHVASPMAGLVASVAVHEGERVAAGAPLLAIEAMKMLSQLYAPHDGVVGRLHVAAGDMVETKDLLVEVNRQVADPNTLARHEPRATAATA